MGGLLDADDAGLAVVVVVVAIAFFPPVTCVQQASKRAWQQALLAGQVPKLRVHEKKSHEQSAAQQMRL